MAGSSLSTPVAVNPYVGPRPFETGEHLFGREHEITKLYYVLSAERIVLLHSPSGAGKSSMIQAGLLPRLRERFDVWRPTRVNLPRPAGISESANRYVLSAALGFEQSIPEELRRSPEELAGMALIDCVRTRKRRPSAPANVLLIFDQFEEILTTDPLAMEARQEFFDQLGEVLRDPTHWALFAMREDFLAPLDPYVERVPTHMQNRFRIDLLGLDEAREAIAQPSQEGGRVFEDAAVGKLVNDLATMKVQQPDGSFQDQVGLHVEPLQLQVVCRGLWERLSPEKRSIAVDDVTELGDVTEALSSYYSMEVSKIADGEEAMEREIREWVGDKLITSDGTRGQVLRGAGKTEGLSNTLVAKLVDTHLVRAEHRAGAVWYELAHDRLIDPTRVDNTKWLDAHLNQVQKRASLWAAQGQPDGLLFLGEDLREARRWAKEHHSLNRSLTEDEQRFLDASAVAQADADKQRKQQRLILWLGVAAGIIAVLCGFALRNAKLQKSKALRMQGLAEKLLAQTQTDFDKDKANDIARASLERANVEAVRNATNARMESSKAEAIAQQEKIHRREEGQVALAGLLLVKANNTLAKRPDLLQLTTLLALESIKRDRSVEADRFLRQSLLWLRNPVGHQIGHAGRVRAIAFSPDDGFIATADDDSNVKVSDALTGQPRFPPLVHEGLVAGLALNGEYLVTVGINGNTRVWNARTGAPVGEPYSLGRAVENIAVCFNSSGLHIANSANDALTVWERGVSPSLRLQTNVIDAQKGEPVGVPVFGPDCKQLTAIRSDTMKVWEVDSSKESKNFPLLAVPDWTSRVFSFSGSHLATFSRKSVSVWSKPARGGLTQDAQLNFDEDITSVAFSPQEGYFATAGADRTARLWHLLGDGGVREVVRLTHTQAVTSIAFSSDGKLLASVDAGNTVRLWSLAGNVEGVTTTFENKSGLRVSISTDGRHVVVPSAENIRVLRADTGVSEITLAPTGQNAGGKIVYADISSDGRYVAASIKETPDFPNSYVRQVWDRNSGAPILRTEGLAPEPTFMFSPDDKYLAIGGSEDGGANLVVRDLKTGKRIHIPSVNRNTSVDQNYQFFFTPDGKYLAVLGQESVHLLDTGTWTDRFPIQAGAPIRRFVMSANGQYLALATQSDKESTMQVWRIADHKLRTSISQKEKAGVARNTSLALTPDGAYLASADWSYSKYSEDRRVRVWDVETRQVAGSMPLEDRANWFSLSADGSLLGVATDGGLKVWDQVHKEEAASTDMAASSLLTTFSPDGKYLLTIDGSQNVTSWFWGPSIIAGAVCGKLMSNLSLEQWKQYLPSEPYQKTCLNRPVPVSAPTK